MTSNLVDLLARLLFKAFVSLTNYHYSHVTVETYYCSLCMHAVQCSKLLFSVGVGRNLCMGVRKGVPAGCEANIPAGCVSCRNPSKATHCLFVLLRTVRVNAGPPMH